MSFEQVVANVTNMNVRHCYKRINWLTGQASKFKFSAMRQVQQVNDSPTNNYFRALHYKYACKQKTSKVHVITTTITIYKVLQTIYDDS